MKKFRLIAILFYITATIGLVNNYYAAAQTPNQASQNSSLAKFQKDYEFLFIYSSTCGYCHKFAPVFRKFLDANNLPAKAVTVNGSTLPSFNKAKSDNTVLDKYNLDGIPAVILIKKSDGSASVFHVGSMSRSGLDSKFNSLLKRTYGN